MSQLNLFTWVPWDSSGDLHTYEMANPFKSRKFKRLKTEWEKKLIESGFQDIENADGSLKAAVDPRTISYALQVKESREKYYSIANAFLQTHKFKGPEKKIWDLHCQAVGARSIASGLNLTPYRVELITDQLKTLAKLKGSEDE